MLLRRVPLPAESVKEQESLINWLHHLASGFGCVLVTVSLKSADVLQRTMLGYTSPACLQ